MKRKLPIFLAGLFLIVALTLPSQADATNANIYINDIQTNNHPPITIEHGQPILPIRYIVEQLNGEINWKADTKTIEAKVEGNSLIFAIGEKFGFKNNKLKYFNSVAVVVNGHTYVPLDFIRSLELQTEWDAFSNSIKIYSPNYIKDQSTPSEVEEPNLEEEVEIAEEKVKLKGKFSFYNGHIDNKHLYVFKDLRNKAFIMQVSEDTISSSRFNPYQWLDLEIEVEGTGNTKTNVITVSNLSTRELYPNKQSMPVEIKEWKSGDLYNQVIYKGNVQEGNLKGIDFDIIFNRNNLENAYPIDNLENKNLIVLADTINYDHSAEEGEIYVNNWQLPLINNIHALGKVLKIEEENTEYVNYHIEPIEGMVTRAKVLKGSLGKKVELESIIGEQFYMLGKPATDDLKTIEVSEWYKIRNIK